MANSKKNNEIDQIREIVFGQQIQSYDKKITEIEAKIEQKFSDLIRKIITETSVLKKIIEDKNLDTKESILKLENKSQDESKLLSDSLKASENKLLDKIEVLSKSYISKSDLKKILILLANKIDD